MRPLFVIVIVILLEWRELRELKFPDHWSKRFVKHYANAIRDHASEVIPLALTPVNNSQKYIFRFAKETKKLIRYLDGFFPRINKLYTFLIFIIILFVKLPPGAPFLLLVCRISKQGTPKSVTEAH
jgi:hypothetical protein